jgi:hypothetical protein
MTLAGAFFPLIYDVTHCSFIYRLPGSETKTEKLTSTSLKGPFLGGLKDRLFEPYGGPPTGVVCPK